MNIDDLKAELALVHPVTGSYNADSILAAAELNAVNIEVNLTSLSGDEMFGATDTTEYGLLSADDKQLWVSFCGRTSIDPFGAANVAFVQSLFAGGVTIAALAAMRTKLVSRATELGLGVVKAGHINEARV